MTNTIRDITLLTENDLYCKASKLYDMGLNITEIQRCLSLMDYDVDTGFSSRITDATTPTTLKSNVQSYENAMQNVNYELDFKVPSMVESPYTWEDTPIDPRVEFNRWFSWSNDFKEICSEIGAEQGNQPLCDEYSELTRDINNHIIYVEVE